MQLRDPPAFFIIIFTWLKSFSGMLHWVRYNERFEAFLKKFFLSKFSSIWIAWGVIKHTVRYVDPRMLDSLALQYSWLISLLHLLIYLLFYSNNLQNCYENITFCRHHLIVCRYNFLFCSRILTCGVNTKLNTTLVSNFDEYKGAVI